MGQGGTGQRGTKSLEVVLQETRIEQVAQLQHFDGLDAKAGILLGFSGAIVALTPSHSLLIGLGRLAAVLAGLIALAAFWPRGFKVTNLLALRQKYLGAEPQLTKLVVLDTQIEMLALRSRVLESKASRLKWATASLAIAIVLLAVGISLD